MRKSNWNRRIRMSKWKANMTMKLVSLTPTMIKAMMSRSKRLSRTKKEQGKTTMHPSTMSKR